VGRGHFPYHTNWNWATFQAFLPTINKTMSINIGVALTNDYDPKDGEKFDGDFLILDSKLYKLDMVELDYTPEDLMQVHRFRTIQKHQAYPQRVCDLTFTPKAIATDGLHLIVLGMV
jgi:hypothetical protein